MKTKAAPDPDHPLVRAAREAKRPHPGDLAAMRTAITRGFGFVIDTNRLEAEEAAELYALHRQALEPEGWQETGHRLYLLSRLSKREHRRWRQLVGKGAGDEHLIDRLDEDAAEVRKIRELAAAALTPVPTRTAAPAGAIVLPPAAWRDVLEGRLLAIDLCVLSVVLFLFQGAELHPKIEKRRDAVWAPGEQLVIRDGLHRLLPGWSKDSHYGDAVGADRQGTEDRLAANQWLEIDRGSPREITVRLGPRVAAQPDGR